ncbi:MAG: uncharacterized protein QOE77_3727 [Blastocatellia bacterium]|jgi:hypothetical protein|nr:uncharacterized protein [Blastocatellia bacterium]
MKYSLIARCAFLLLAAASVALAQNGKGAQRQQVPDVRQTTVTGERAREIRTLLDLLPETPGGTSHILGGIDVAIETYRKAYPNVAEAVWREMAPELRRDFGPDKLTELLAPVYAKEFTSDEIRQLIAFFQSPIGQKWNEKFRLLGRASFDVGDMLGFMIGQRMNEILKAKGYKLAR